MTAPAWGLVIALVLFALDLAYDLGRVAGWREHANWTRGQSR